MNAREMARLADFYHDALVSEGITAEKMDESTLLDLTKDEDRKKLERHVVYGTGILKQLAFGNFELAERWLGFIQASLLALGFYSIEEMRQHNMDANAAE